MATHPVIKIVLPVICIVVPADLVVVVGVVLDARALVGPLELVVMFCVVVSVCVCPSVLLQATDTTRSTSKAFADSFQLSILQALSRNLFTINTLQYSLSVCLSVLTLDVSLSLYDSLI